MVSVTSRRRSGEVLGPHAALTTGRAPANGVSMATVDVTTAARGPKRGRTFSRRNESISRFPTLSRQRYVIVVTCWRGHVTALLVYGGYTGQRFGTPVTST